MKRRHRFHHDAVRRLDKNHLMFGDKNRVEIENEFLIGPLRKYVDVVVVQSYNSRSKNAGTTASLYEKTGKPIFNGNGCFAYVHSKPTISRWREPDPRTRCY